jgi:hypothetical protein
VWLRSASEDSELSMYHPIGLGDPDPRFSDSIIKLSSRDALRSSIDRPASKPPLRRALRSKRLSCGYAHFRVQPNVARRTFYLPSRAPLTPRSEDRAAGKQDPEVEAGNSHGVWCPYDA